MRKNLLFNSVIGATMILVGAFSVIAQKDLTIAEIQGDKGTSPHDKAIVRTTGVVTAILAKGFYIQTPDDKTDKNPATSEGLYVYGENSVGQVALRDLVSVEGTVIEFRPPRERIFLSITEITRPTVKVISKDSVMPAAIALTSAELDPKGRIDQVERFEGMRVKGDFYAVAPTGGFTDEKTGVSRSSGIFFAVLQGTPRPFREAGVGILSVMVDKLPATTPTFDMNPEILRVDSTQQTGSKAIDVTSGATPALDETRLVASGGRFWLDWG